jgi:aspartate/methionine/tyrosine aminotransferase
LKYDEHFKPNLDTLRKLIKHNTKLICLTHPNNPTGSVITKNELNQLIELVEERNIFLIMDETYRDLTFEEPIPTGASLSDKIISISTMSKVYGVPGIRIGWFATKDESIINGVLNVREQTTICNAALNEATALQILIQRESYLSNLLP